VGDERCREEGGVGPSAKEIDLLYWVRRHCD
jgi:hypothetical protein